MASTRNKPLKICLQLRDICNLPRNTRIGEYICLPPHLADGHARAGNVAIVTGVLRPSDIEAAGGWRKLVAQNPKLRAMSIAEEMQINKVHEKYAPVTKGDRPDEED